MIVNIIFWVFIKVWIKGGVFNLNIKNKNRNYYYVYCICEEIEKKNVILYKDIEKIERLKLVLKCWG